MSPGTMNTQNMRATVAHVMDSELVEDLHGTDVDGGRGEAEALEP